MIISSWVWKKGNLLFWKAFGGAPLVRKFWSESAKGVFILNDEEYEKRVRGHASLEPVGFPIEDVFSYCVENKHLLHNTKSPELIPWGKMIPYRKLYTDTDSS